VIILMHPKYQAEIDSGIATDRLRRFMSDARIPNGTPVFFDRNLPEEDDEGRPIFGFKVSGGECHYWRGEPLTIPKT
jgi:hypothetical protein